MTLDRLLRTLDQPRRLIWAAFGAIVAAAWGTLLGADPIAADLWRSLCGPSHAGAGYHMAMWVAMVFAMMLPSAAPMISTYMDIAEAARRKAIPVRDFKTGESQSVPLVSFTAEINPFGG